MYDVDAAVMWGDLGGKHLKIDRLGAFEGGGIDPCLVYVPL